MNLGLGVADGSRVHYTSFFVFPRLLKVIRRTAVRQRAAGMRFNLVDRIVEVQPGKAIRAAKNLTLGEEYLADHFPSFPVMPGVLMLQTLIEAGAWLLRITEDFRHSVIVLREAKGVKYGSFMEPGRQMVISVDLLERAECLATFKGKGDVEGNSVVSARFTLKRYNLADRDPALRATDERMVSHLKTVYALLKGDLVQGPRE
jgi:3-hydroxyacyl-[acyl-carrier-protein] dehydratase